jgi:hypothetical protein
MEERGMHNKILVVKPVGKRPLGKRRYKWEDNINMELREIGWGGMDWFHLAEARDQWTTLVNMAMNIWVP